MQAGPFEGHSFNLDVISLSFTGQDADASIAPFQVQEIPIPAAFWLFGSGLLALIGMTRRRPPRQA